MYLLLQLISIINSSIYLPKKEGHHDRDCMVVGFTTTCAISAYHH